MTKVTQHILDALKQALAEPGEQRLYSAGKLSGLFAGRGGTAGEAAAQALQEGLLEIVRTEIRGKVGIDWVRITPRGVDFIHAQESPLAALRDLQHALRTTQDGIPALQAEIGARLTALGDALLGEVQTLARRLAGLEQRVGEALARVEALRPALGEETLKIVPWASGMLAYLDRRREGGALAPCPLPEMFAALLPSQPGLTISDFHAGLRRLYDRGVVRLLPTDGSNGLTEPEYALLDGIAMYYYVSR